MNSSVVFMYFFSRTYSFISEYFWYNKLLLTFCTIYEFVFGTIGRSSFRQFSSNIRFRKVEFQLPITPSPPPQKYLIRVASPTNQKTIKCKVCTSSSLCKTFDYIQATDMLVLTVSTTNIPKVFIFNEIANVCPQLCKIRNFNHPFDVRKLFKNCTYKNYTRLFGSVLEITRFEVSSFV